MNDQPIDEGTDPQHSVSPARLEANWRAVEIELDTPRPSRVETVLRAFGVPSWATRLIVATPALRRSWYLAIAGAAFIALSTSGQDATRQSVLVFLTISPLVGVLGVAMAYGPTADPAHELHLTTPMSGLRVLAVRVLVVLAVSTLSITVFALLNSTTRAFAAAWYLPALAVTSAALALMTVLTPRRATTTVGVVWSGMVLVSQLSSDPLVLFTVTGQVAAVLVTAAGAFATVRRRAAFDRLSVAS